jgi:hypothetical protein
MGVTGETRCASRVGPGAKAEAPILRLEDGRAGRRGSSGGRIARCGGGLSSEDWNCPGNTPGGTRGNWLSLIITLAVPCAAMLRRISVEETALVETLGRRSEVYRAHTKRLVPGLW